MSDKKHYVVSITNALHLGCPSEKPDQASVPQRNHRIHAVMVFQMVRMGSEHLQVFEIVVSFVSVFMVYHRSLRDVEYGRDCFLRDSLSLPALNVISGFSCSVIGVWQRFGTKWAIC